MKLLYALFIFLTFPVNAEIIANSSRPVTIIHESGNIILEANSCNILMEQQDALSEWKDLLDGEFSISDSCFCTDYQENWPVITCRLPVTTSLPKKVMDMYGKKYDHHGPNCFNTALVANEILPHRTYTTPEEMSFWLESPLCRELKENESPHPGNIVAIRRNNGNTLDEVHSFIYISPEISFSKNNILKNAPARLMSTDFVYYKFGIKRRNQECQKEFSMSSQCRRTAQVYTCQKWDEYWQGQEFTKSESESLKQIENLECMVSKKVTEGSDQFYDENFLHNNLSVLLSLAAKKGSKFSRKPTTQNLNIKFDKIENRKLNDEEFFWDSIVYRVMSLYQQMGLVF